MIEYVNGPLAKLEYEERRRQRRQARKDWLLLLAFAASVALVAFLILISRAR